MKQLSHGMFPRFFGAPFGDFGYGGRFGGHPADFFPGPGHMGFLGELSSCFLSEHLLLILELLALVITTTWGSLVSSHHVNLSVQMTNLSIIYFY